MADQDAWSVGARDGIVWEAESRGRGKLDSNGVTAVGMCFLELGTRSLATRVLDTWESHNGNKRIQSITMCVSQINGVAARLTWAGRSMKSSSYLPTAFGSRCVRMALLALVLLEG